MMKPNDTPSETNINSVPHHLRCVDKLECAPDEKYVITEEIVATGRMYVIHGACLSLDTTHGPRFAVKMKKQEYKKDISNTERQEIYALKLLLFEKNVINLLDIIREPGDLMMVMELGVIDLAKIVRKNKNIEIDATEKRTIMYQFINGVAAIHRNGLIHRDIKFSNLLIMENGVLKITDFGDSTPHASSLKDEKLSLNGGTTYYKPLEVLFGDETYDEKIDIWALGCSMGELFTRGIIFQGASKTNDCQVSEIVNLCGFPSVELWPKLASLKWYEHYYDMFGNLTLDYTQEFAMNITGKDAIVADLLCSLLMKLPNQRVSANEALTHAYFTQDAVAADVKSLLVKFNELKSNDGE